MHQGAPSPTPHAGLIKGALLEAVIAVEPLTNDPLRDVVGAQSFLYWNGRATAIVYKSRPL